MTKKFKIITASVIGVLAMALSFFSGYLTRELIIDEDARSAMYLIEKYKKYYYFESDDIIDVISSSLLDKYSKYYTAEEYEKIQRSSKGYTDGIGLVFKGESLIIDDVLGNSPAQIAGVESGGEITAYNCGKGFVSAVSPSDTLSAITSLQNGCDITLKINYGDEFKTYTLTKKEYLRTYVTYESNSGSYAFQGDNLVELVKISDKTPSFSKNTAYIKYSSFGGLESGVNGSAGQIAAALEFFKSENKTDLIFDLRGNGGGYLDIMNEVAAYVTPAAYGEKLVTLYSENKSGCIEKYYSSKSKFQNYNVRRMIVMLDENSASASEALTGAICDYANKYDFDLKVLVSSSALNGEIVYKSYGKGIMQTTYYNPDKSAVKLTTARLYWPLSGTCIHDVGITSSVSKYVVNAQKELALQTAIDLFS